MICVIVARAKNSSTVMAKPEYYIGLMAGTSLDGVDGVIIDANDADFLTTAYLPYSDSLKNELRILTQTGQIQLVELAELDRQVAGLFAETVQTLLKKSGILAADIRAIGSHGQTIFHQGGYYSMQIGHGALIAEQTHIPVVNDFRMNDIAIGGQGAPLTPLYHQHLLGGDGIVINLGGIANLTQVSLGKVGGFDTGPANVLLDQWMQKSQQLDYDKNGEWARSGTLDEDLLSALLADAYFQKPAPKSTGSEYFNLTWLAAHLSAERRPQDVQRTLLELSAISISAHICAGSSVYLCGGGVHNAFLIERLSYLNPNSNMLTTAQLGMDADYVEAAAFAFFAKLTLHNKPANLTAVTGAKALRVLGAIHPFSRENATT